MTLDSLYSSELQSLLEQHKNSYLAPLNSCSVGYTIPQSVLNVTNKRNEMINDLKSNGIEVSPSIDIDKLIADWNNLQVSISEKIKGMRLSAELDIEGVNTEGLVKYKDIVNAWKEHFGSDSEPPNLDHEIPTKIKASAFNYDANAIMNMLSAREQIEKQIASIKSVVIQPVQYDVTAKVMSKYDQLESQSNSERERILSEHMQSVEARQREYEEYSADVARYNNSLTNPFKESHQRLLAYKEQLKDIFERYDITPFDMELSDDITPDEFHVLIDQCIAVCEKYSAKENDVIKSKLGILKDNTNLTFTASVTLVGTLLLYFALPVLAIPAFISAYKSIHNLYFDLEKLRLARLLMSEIDYNRFVNEEDKAKNVEMSIDDLNEQLSANLASVVDYSGERDEAMRAAAEFNVDAQMQINKVTEELNKAYSDTINKLTAKVAEINKQLADLISVTKMFPNVQSSSAAMSHNYVLGRLAQEGFDVTAEVPMKNIVFDSSNREAALANLKLYLCNALLSVKVKQLTIDICDQQDMCQDFSEFFTPETKDYIRPNTKSIDKVIEDVRKYAQQNIIELDGLDIDTFNRDAEAKGMVCKEYRLIILVSGLARVYGDYKKQKEEERKNAENEFIKFLEYSASKGVIIWMIDSLKVPNTLFVSSINVAKGNVIAYDRTIGKQAIATFTKELANYKDGGIAYAESFANKYIPQEKWWTWDTIKGINVHYGLENGDPTRGFPVVIGDANVHSLLGGATGAGKSAAINQTLISLITMYPPSELELVYIDFKNVEAAKFTQGYRETDSTWLNPAEEKDLRNKGLYYKRVSRIPHLRIISGTTDGEYALSVFEFLMQEMARRQAIINKYGVTKLEEMRKQILEGYNASHGTPKGTWADMRKDWEWYKHNVYDIYGDLPRMLIVFDEFQVMYNPEFVSFKIIDKINGKITAITKLARAMGCHFWFTSQSMKGTMPKDTMDNFSLRGALRCTDSVSTELIGNPAAATIKAKFGYMYTNDSAGTDPGANKLWRVPFLDEKLMKGYIDKLNDMLHEFNEKHLMATFYDEKILVPADILHEHYDLRSDVLSSSTIFDLGERANYSTNAAPVCMTLVHDTGENVLVGAFDRNDLMNLILTLAVNIKRSSNGIIAMNIRDKDTYNLIGAEELIDPRFAAILDMKLELGTVIQVFESLVNSRRDDPTKREPLYIFLIQWERTEIAANYSLQDRLSKVLKEAPTLAIHFIFCIKEVMELPRSLVSTCNHRITGLMPQKSNFFTNNEAVEKFPDANKDAGLFALYEFGTSSEKFRIYQHEMKGEIESRVVEF